MHIWLEIHELGILRMGMLRMLGKMLGCLKGRRGDLEDEKRQILRVRVLLVMPVDQEKCPD